MFIIKKTLYVYLLVSLPYLISLMHGLELFKIQLAFHHRGLN